jgi:hypothetical protein
MLEADLGDWTMLDIPDVLKRAEEYLLRSTDADVPLGWRVRLWDAMNTAFGQEESLFRRGVLAYVVGKDTLAPWDKIKSLLQN